jgi:hypothetical protein
MDVASGIDRQFVNTESWASPTPGINGLISPDTPNFTMSPAFLNAERRHGHLNQTFSANFNQRFRLVIGRTQFEIHRTVEAHTEIYRDRRFEERQ